MYKFFYFWQIAPKTNSLSPPPPIIMFSITFGFKLDDNCGRNSLLTKGTLYMQCIGLQVTIFIRLLHGLPFNLKILHILRFSH